MTRDSTRPMLRLVSDPRNDQPHALSPRHSSAEVTIQSAPVRPDRPTESARSSLVVPSKSASRIDGRREAEFVRQTVAAENRRASTLSPIDARWVLATRIAQQLEGGQLAMLRPHRRDAIERLAVTLGLRPFDAQLIIAIVQDNVRTTGLPLGHAVADRLLLVQPAGTSSQHANDFTWPQIAIALVFGVLIAMIGILWILKAPLL